jgi:pimeloyl-ACP methyl ester carboxylesterase
MRLNYVRRGEGPPLLLLHALGGSLVQWSPVVEALAAERDVIAIDMPGFGDSPELPASTEPSAANLASAALDFCGSLGIDGDLGVAGISLGGWTAIECARQGGARSAVALCPAGFWRKPLDPSNPKVARTRRAGRLLRPLIGPVMRTAGGRRRLLGRSFSHAERLSPAEAAEVATAYVTAPAYPRANALMRAGTVGSLDEVEAPITIAWAEHDQLIRNRPLRDGILPGEVTQLVLRGCGHVPTWDDPGQVARVILDGTRERRTR